MADEKATFSVELEDHTSGPAEDAAAALERMRDTITKSQSSLRDMTAAMGRLKGSSAEVVAQKKLLADRITAERVKLGEAQAAYLKAGGALGDLGKATSAAKKDVVDLTKAAGEAKSEASTLGGSLERLGVPLSELKKKSRALGEVLGSSRGIGLAMAAAGVAAVALAAVLAALTVAALAAVVAIADGARSNQIYLAALTGSAAGGDALAATITNVSKNVALSRAELQGLASDLFLAGLSGDDLAAALESVATVQATVGAGPAGKLKSALEEAAKTGTVVVDGLEAIGLKGQYTFAELQKAVDQRFGASAKAQLLSLPVLFERLKTNASGMFSGLNIEPVLKVLEGVVKLFGESTVTGKALRKIVDTLFQPLIDFVGRNGPVVNAFFKGLVVAALVFVLAVLKIKNALKAAFGGESTKGLSSLKVAMMVGAAIAGLFFAALLGVVMGLVLIGAMVAIPIMGVKALWDKMSEAYDKISGMDWAGIGTAIIDAISDAITSGAAKVASSVKSMGATALKAGKEFFEIRSPAKKVRREIGQHIPSGLAGGIDDGVPMVKRAMVSLGRTALDSGKNAIGSGARKAAGGGSQAPISVGELHMHLEGVKDPEAFKAQARPALIEIFRELSRGGLAPT